MTLKEKLLQDAQAYCDEKPISLARLATIVVNDGKFFDRIKGGGDCTTKIYERFQTYFHENTDGKEAA